ncbi:hypothetical protein V502_10544 [Pseudogymnoascus sp. VKM F-4520 (FW-2644)]|nr:hypothetical protein V502_10544 [Pseudogymnoascus sp. VKM F-4520 (FW-2644)]
MPDLRSAIASFMERYPQISSALYQLLLCLITFECMLSIARYDHNPDGSSPVLLSPTNMNATHEHICKISAREADIPVGPLRYAIPYFMLCPSTFTLIGLCIVFVACLIKWSSFYSDSPTEILPWIVILTGLNINWSRILESVQMLLPMYIWIGYTIRALFDTLFQWAMPVSYANLVESKKEIRRLAEEKRNKRKIGDIEGGEQTQFDEETPLTGRGFTRDRNGAYV